MKTNEQKQNHAASQRTWRTANREKARAISRVASTKYNAANPEKRKESSAAYQQRVRAKLKADPIAHREYLNDLARHRYAAKVKADPGYIKRKALHGKKWRLENPELAKQYAREATQRWRAANPEKVREQTARSKPKKDIQQSAARRNMRMALLAFFGGKCVKCGFDDGRALHLDHINGNGNADRRVGKGNKRDQYKLIQSDPEKAREKYQLLCANCNTIKQFENGEYRTVG